MPELLSNVTVLQCKFVKSTKQANRSEGLYSIEVRIKSIVKSAKPNKVNREILKVVTGKREGL